MNAEQEIRAVLRREAGDVDPAPVPWAEVRRRAAEARRVRLLGALSVAAAVTAFGVFALTGGGDGVQRLEVTDRRTEAPPSTDPTADPTSPTTSGPSLVRPTTTAVVVEAATATTRVASTAGPTTTTVVPVTTTAVPATTVVPPTTTVTTAPAQPEGCTTPEGGTDQPIAQAEFEARIAHAWRLCGTTSVFGTQEAGLEIRADHRWSKLAPAGDGRFVRLAGWGNEGTWESVDTSAMNGPGRWQLNLNVDGGGTVITLPVFARDVPKVRLNNTGVYVADYVQLPEGSVAG